MMKRCAVYTRKSTEEGLDQAFNSLDAQREACESFIASQKGEGWKLIRTRFDDGGLSGGNMERPALKALLAEIESGNVDIVVVYKVDRLTRSLADFAKLVERFDARGVSFVSVTQAFNTSSSMGRLTLNVLLSFAQFEREVTAERIRDKIRASRRKGMWTGGNAPLGYDNVDKKLVVNEEEAASVRRIFTLYNETGCGSEATRLARAEGIVTKKRACGTGGNPITQGPFYHVLSNPLYAGLTRAGDALHPGQHQAIIPKEEWEAVQALLKNKSLLGAARRKQRNPLAGKLFVEGERLTPSAARRGERLYRYYVSKVLESGPQAASGRWRLAADAVENTILALIETTLSSPDTLTGLVAKDADAARTRSAHAALVEVARERSLLTVDERLRLWADAILRVDIARDAMTLTLRARSLVPDALQDAVAESIELRSEVKFDRRRQGVRLILGGVEQNQAPDDVALRLLARAHRWRDRWFGSDHSSLDEIAASDGVDGSDASKQLKLAFLAPDIIAAVLTGHAGLSAERLRRLSYLPASWDEQRRLLLGS